MNVQRATSIGVLQKNVFFFFVNKQPQGVFADEDCWYMVMELAEGGELFDRLTTEGLVLEDGEVRSLLRDTADAIAYLHDHSIVHGDVKPENMLLTAPTTTTTNAISAASGENQAAAAVAQQVREREGGVRSEAAPGRASGAGGEEGGGVGNVLLADFGSSFRMREDGTGGGGMKTVKEYTVAYSAPEVVNNSPVVDQKVDVWSLGVIAYVMVSLVAFRGWGGGRCCRCCCRPSGFCLFFVFGCESAFGRTLSAVSVCLSDWLGVYERVFTYFRFVFFLC